MRRAWETRATQTGGFSNMEWSMESWLGLITENWPKKSSPEAIRDAERAEKGSEVRSTATSLLRVERRRTSPSTPERACFRMLSFNSGALSAMSSRCSSEKSGEPSGAFLKLPGCSPILTLQHAGASAQWSSGEVVVVVLVVERDVGNDPRIEARASRADMSKSASRLVLPGNPDRNVYIMWR